jgi:alpha-galactosidase
MPGDQKKSEKLALTPPMGWNSYNTFNCEPNEELLRGVADAIVATGLKDAGYVYINIDDGWTAKERDKDGNLVPDAIKFPNGLRTVTDYIHSKGLLAGIYLGAGIKTYGEYPGTLGYEEKDAALIASLEFDFLKYDYRELPEDPPGRDVKTEFIRMRKLLDATGRPILFSICEHGRSKPWEWGAGVGHMWRTTPDIKDGFDGDLKWGWGFNQIIERTHQLYSYAGPGRWNDPDMLVVGLNGKLEWQGPGCSEAEYRAHFALWCLCSAPLLIGCDVRNMDDTTRAILMNRELIAVNQDVLGKQGRIIKKDDLGSVWLKELRGEALAIGFYNISGSTRTMSISWNDLGLRKGKQMTIRDLWTQRTYEAVDEVLSCPVSTHDIAVFKMERFL